MANDLRCYLDGDLVAAAAPTFFYQAKKLYQRHRAICMTLVTAASLLVVTSLVSLNWGISNSRLKAKASKYASELKQESERLEKINAELEHARDRARDAEWRALKMANEKRKQAAKERAANRFVFGNLEDISRLFENNGKFEITSDTQIRTIPPAIADNMEKMSKAFSKELGSKLVGNMEVKTDGAGFQIAMPPRSVTHVDRFQATGSLATSFFWESNPESQSKFFEFLIAEYRREFGTNHPVVAESLLDCSVALMRLDPVKWAQVESRTREALSILEAASTAKPEGFVGANLFLHQKASLLLAKSLDAQGRSPEARDIFKSCHVMISDLESNLSAEQRKSLLDLIEKLDEELKSRH